MLSYKPCQKDAFIEKKNWNVTAHFSHHNEVKLKL